MSKSKTIQNKEQKKLIRNKPKYLLKPGKRSKNVKKKRKDMKEKNPHDNTKEDLLKQTESWFEFGSNIEQTTTEELRPQPTSSMDLEELELRLQQSETIDVVTTMHEENEIGFQVEFQKSDKGSEASTNTETESENESESESENENENENENIYDLESGYGFEMENENQNKNEDLNALLDKVNSKSKKKEFKTDLGPWNKDGKFRFGVVSNKKSVKEKRRKRIGRSYSRANNKSNTEPLYWRKKKGLRRVKSDEADDLFVSEFDGFVIMRSSDKFQKAPPRVSLTIEEIEKMEQRNLEKQRLKEIEKISNQDIKTQTQTHNTSKNNSKNKTNRILLKKRTKKKKVKIMRKKFIKK
ncbi:hypothetical protein M0812_06491 [Anaeramoeba flamelloides]|uniref:Uncharacterized protein n=1 Tax=Anaeramoeba flamelloides TaxID=1746091 RepID=A0AAV8A9K9_9EUKA|nr:hypothetical protein M0812_06491 [Anaeramoeba flamelloides]